MARTRRRLRAIMILLALPLATACYRPYLQAGTPPALLFTGEELAVVQIGRKDGRMLTLHRARVSGDTLWGQVPGETSRTGVAMSDIEWGLVKASRLDGRLTALFAGSAIFIGLFIAFLLSSPF